MKIFFLSSKLSETGGIQEYNRNLLKALKDNKNKVFLIERGKRGLISKFLFALEFFLKTLFLKPDIIFCGHINFSPLCLLIKKVFGIDFIIFTHGIEVWNVKKNLHKRSFKKSIKIVSVSEFTAKKIRKQVPEVKSKQFILPNTVDPNRFYIKNRPNYLIKRHKLKGKKVIFTLARLSKTEEYKGYDKVIKAMPQIIREFPDSTYILGGKGDDIPRIKKLIKSNKVENQVILPGFIPDEKLIDYYNLADVFVMPSKKEGFGIVFLEALACGTPVVAGNKDASKEAVLEGEVGLLVDPDDIDYIADTLTKVLQNKVREGLLDRQFLRKRVLEEYSFEQFTEKVKRLNHDLQEQIL
jgi:glycosyltransferase involved in cell wall biosynthesis